MRTSISFAGILVAAVLLAWGIGGQAFAADAKAEITDLEYKEAAATTADEALALCDTGDDLVVYDLSTPREFDGPKAVREDFQNFFSSTNNLKIEFINLHVISDGKLGVAESVQHITATDKSGKPVDMIFRATDVWRIEKGGWKIIHSHVSFPIDMASGKADMQSK
jgi:ketosteroid isomerase-like protein